MHRLLVPRFLLLCGLKHRRPRERVWRCKSGIQVTGFGDHGPPFGRSRMILLYLTNRAAESGRAFRGTLDEITAMFGVSWLHCTLEQHFLRVIESTYQPGEPACERCQVHRWSSRSLDVIRRVHYCEADGSFDIEVGGELAPDAQTSFSCPLEPITEMLRSCKRSISTSGITGSCLVVTGRRSTPSRRTALSVSLRSPRPASSGATLFGSRTRS